MFAGGFRRKSSCSRCWLRVSAVYLVLFSWCVASTRGADEVGTVVQALLKFKASFSAAALDGWDASVAPCNGNGSSWKGVHCLNGVVFNLRLENLGLTNAAASTELDLRPLAAIAGLRSLSLMHNRLDGPIPRGVNSLRSLRSLYLAYNWFSGEIGEEVFNGMKALKKVHLEFNRFSGEIPETLAYLPRLIELDAEGNSLRGKLPDFQQKGLVMVNVANNRLWGRIPAGLRNMNATFFTGNRRLCGKPLGPCRYSRHPSPWTAAFLAASIVVFVVLLAFAAAFCFQRLYHPRKRVPESPKQSKSFKESVCFESQLHAAAYISSIEKSGGEARKLHFVRNDREKFSLQELLQASAEAFGSGGFGSSYKAVLASNHVVVVKRFKYMNDVGKEEFYEHMKKIGRLSHPNLLPLVAFYYRREEKLLVTDFIPNGSLANLLHADLTPGQAVINWPTRLKIIKGVARGLSYLYRVFPGVDTPHGHLKSSNVLLDQNYEPILTDYALIPMVNKEQSIPFMVTYQSPEFTLQKQTSRKTDVWSLGLLILEILTGNSPANCLQEGNDANASLAAWVESVAKKEGTTEVFDKDMRATEENQGDMMKLLKIGIRCCEFDMEKRIEMREAAERIEELGADRGSREEFDDARSSYVTASEGGDYRSSRAMTEDFSRL